MSVAKNFSEFRAFLTSRGLGERTIQDYVSRCRRIEKELAVSIDIETSSEDRYLSLAKRIKTVYRIERSATVFSGYAAAQLNSALRRYAEFRWGHRLVSKYPYLYSRHI